MRAVRPWLCAAAAARDGNPGLALARPRRCGRHGWRGAGRRPRARCVPARPQEPRPPPGRFPAARPPCRQARDPRQGSAAASNSSIRVSAGKARIRTRYSSSSRPPNRSGQLSGASPVSSAGVSPRPAPPAPAGSPPPGHDLSAHPPIHPGAGRRGQQLACRLSRQPAEHQLRQPGQRISLPFAGGEQHRHPVGVQAAADEPEHLHRHLIQPLGAIHQAQHRPPGRRVRQQRRRRQPDQERVRRRPGHQPESRLQRLPLRPGQPGQPPRNGTSNWCSPANPIPISACTPVTRASCMSCACPAARSSSTVFPMPASPRRTSTPLSPSRTAASTASSAAVSMARSSSSLIAQPSCHGRGGPASPSRSSPLGGIRPSSLTCHRRTSRSRPPEGPARQRGERTGDRFGLPDERIPVTAMRNRQA